MKPSHSEVRREMMVEMDRFVRTLTGSEEETLLRRSRDSLATMKEHGGTLTRSEDYITETREAR